MWRSVNTRRFPHHRIFCTQQWLYFVWMVYACVSVRSYLAGDPVCVVCDACVNARRVFLPAAVTPADQSHQSHPAVFGTHQRTAGIPLKNDQEKPITKEAEITRVMQTEAECVVTLQASSRPRVSPAHSMFGVTRRPDSFSGTHCSCGHKRTRPRLIRSE